MEDQKPKFKTFYMASEDARDPTEARLLACRWRHVEDIDNVDVIPSFRSDR